MTILHELLHHIIVFSTVLIRYVQPPWFHSLVHIIKTWKTESQPSPYKFRVLCQESNTSLNKSKQQTTTTNINNRKVLQIL